MFPLHDHPPSQNVPFVTISLIVLNSVIYIYLLQIIDVAEFQTRLLRFGVLPAA